MAERRTDPRRHRQHCGNSRNKDQVERAPGIRAGGDLFAMAAAICEQIAAGPDAWRALDLVFVPGITAMLAVAARIGAPLGHDFCALSLSDNLEPLLDDRPRLEIVGE